jgi:hypothetical protein
MFEIKSKTGIILEVEAEPVGGYVAEAIVSLSVNDYDDYQGASIHLTKKELKLLVKHLTAYLDDK